MRHALALFFSLLLSAPAFAADNAIIVTPGTGVTLRSKDVGSGVQSPLQIPGDTSGNALATAPGTPNGSFALPIQGVTGGTAVPVSGTFYQTTQPVSIASAQVASGALAAGSMVDFLTMRGPAAPGTATSYSWLAGCIYQSPLSPSSGQQMGLSCDGDGTLAVYLRDTTTSVVNWGGTSNAVATPQANNTDTVSALTAGAIAANSYGLLWNGTTYDRAYGDKTNGAFVNVKNSSLTVAQSTSSNFKAQVDPLTIATWGLMSGTTPGTAPTNTGIIGGIYNSSAPSPSSGNTLPLQLDASGRLIVNVGTATGIAPGSAYSSQTGSLILCENGTAYNTNSGTNAYLNMLSCDTNNNVYVHLGVGANIAGKFGIDQTTPGTSNGVTLVPSTAGGVSNYVLEPTAGDNHAVIKAGAGQVYGIHAFNNSATINYGRLYNASTGFNGCNSATGLLYEFHIPASTSDAGFVVSIPVPIAFSTGISICVTSAYGQTNTTNATATAMSIDVQYN